jgi:hypothetical protein
MPGSPKRGGFVHRHLIRRPVRYFVAGLAVAVLGFVVGIAELRHVLRLAGGWPQPVQEEFLEALFALFVCVLGTGGIGLAAYSLWSALTLFARHPDVTYLGRYGPPRQVAAAVDAEMADTKNVLQIGYRMRSFRLNASGRGSDYSAEAYLTPNWIVCISNAEADRLTIFRTEDLVVASRIPAPPTSLLFRPLNPHVWVALIDRYGVRVHLPFPEADATRLLAEILGRVPWAVSRFGATAPPVQDVDVGRIVAEATRRREQIRLSDQTPPTSPS